MWRLGVNLYFFGGMMYKICVYVPSTHLELVKNALFAAGAGKIGHYDSCAWQVLGQGQFRALRGSQPFLGALDVLETVAEYRVELVCDAAHIAPALKALLNAHPYEEPAYDVMPILAVHSLV
jgi:hypothetical protein